MRHAISGSEHQYSAALVFHPARRNLSISERFLALMSCLAAIRERFYRPQYKAAGSSIAHSQVNVGSTQGCFVCPPQNA
jgi:hypothetical protein